MKKIARVCGVCTFFHLCHDHDDIRETVREGWVSEVTEGQFPYLYFWPC